MRQVEGWRKEIGEVGIAGGGGGGRSLAKDRTRKVSVTPNHARLYTSCPFPH